MASKDWCKLAARELGLRFEDKPHDERWVPSMFGSKKNPYKYWIVRKESSGKEIWIPFTRLGDCETFLSGKLRAKLGR